MRLAVISDLHLGRGDAADAFGHDDASFLRFLRFLESEFERIVLLGDVFETLTSPWPGRHRAELAAARAAHPDLARRFSGPRYVYVHGNHDLVAGEVLGAPEEWRLDTGGMRLLFTHGHQHDRLIRHARWLSETGVFLGGWLRRWGLGSLYRTIDRWDRALRGASAKPGECRFQRWALELARRREVDVVVTGHTHEAAQAVHEGRVFLNSGSCAHGGHQFLHIDTGTGTFGVSETW